MPTSPNKGWTPRATFHIDGNRGPPPHVQEHLKTCAAAATERLQVQNAEEVKESQEKYDRGGNISYPRTGRDHKRFKKKPRGRHISPTAGASIGKVRGEAHDADTDFEARTHASLDKRALRRGQGGRHRQRTGHPHRKRGRGGPYTGPSQLSATPGLMVVPFQPDEIEIRDPNDDVILVQGQFCIPRRDIVSFLGKQHHLVYSKDREVPVTVSVDRSRVDEPVNAGPVTTEPSSLAESTPSSMAEPTSVVRPAAEAPSSMAEPTTVVRPAAEAPSSMAEPTTVVRPAAEAPSSVVEHMEVSRPAAAAPSTMAEPMEISRPAAAAPSSMAEYMEVSGPTAAAPSLLTEPMPVITPSALSDGEDGIIADHDREDQRLRDLINHFWELSETEGPVHSPLGT